MSEETILLIDMDQMTEQKVVSSLESEGHLVFTATGKGAAIQIAQRVSPTLICIDPSASGGLGTCQELHDNESLAKVPILVITSYGGEMEPRFTALYGIVDFLKAPFTEEELLDKVRICLRAVVQEQQTQGEEPEISREKSEMPVDEKQAADINEHEVLFDEDTAAETEPGPSLQTARHTASGAYRQRRSPRKPGSRNRMTFLVLVLLIITAAGIGTGIYAYRFFREAPEEAKPLNIQSPETRPDMTKTPPVPEQPQAPQPISGDDQKPVREQAVQAPVLDKGSEPVAAKKPGTKAGYSVQVGAFKSLKNAEALAKKLRESGLEAFIQEGPSKDKETVYRVLIGRHSDRKDAAAAAALIKDKTGTSVAIFSE